MFTLFIVCCLIEVSQLRMKYIDLIHTSLLIADTSTCPSWNNLHDGCIPCMWATFHLLEHWMDIYCCTIAVYVHVPSLTKTKYLLWKMCGFQQWNQKQSYFFHSAKNNNNNKKPYTQHNTTPLFGFIDVKLARFMCLKSKCLKSKHDSLYWVIENFLIKREQRTLVTKSNKGHVVTAFMIRPAKCLIHLMLEQWSPPRSVFHQRSYRHSS